MKKYRRYLLVAVEVETTEVKKAEYMTSVLARDINDAGLLVG